MDQVGIILLTLFLTLLVFGPLYRPISLTYARVKDHRRFHPRTSQFKNARRKLSTVSECTPVGCEKPDVESGLNKHDSEPECPICIAPLFVSNNSGVRATTGGQPVFVQAVATLAPSDEDGCGPASNAEQQTRQDSGSVEHRVSKGINSLRLSRVAQLWQRPRSDRCQHAFHAKCLSSWFLIERYDCPVCRSQYWQTREMRTRAASAPPGPSSFEIGVGAGRTGDGSGTGPRRPPPVRMAVERFGVPIL
ncbi:hypothetical protein Cob_v013104 [Colletotrichum orbiculare MAFF 240422]|uniref:RING-type domain-containing protein n=1 Tax=Colletotrichum orbiculare (strain 104-T / ATCC 96160 / CBS 514.97 / LARS 414 / MAFF 240422) TaxID=1213857 RepID=A0A484F993_COLOR|nr:hypothetical protein Cob_v013104 [Colletotrichum orbiculare MAFF 240422]